MCDIVSERLHLTFIDKVDWKLQGFKYFGA